jgi:carbonic anhydrase/acetyltransferase-like protein (isoleucine patch superfamily)
MPPEIEKRFAQAAYIHPTVCIYGSVEIGAGASLWPYAVIRAESREVRIGRTTNLQDHVMVHVGYHAPTIVGDYCSITHRVVLHGCTIGDNCLIGIGATIMEGALPGGRAAPHHSRVCGIPALCPARCSPIRRWLRAVAPVE